MPVLKGSLRPFSAPFHIMLTLWLALSVLLSGCGATPAALSSVALTSDQSTPGPEIPAASDGETLEATVTPFPSRPRYAPGELVDYVAQSGDTLPFLARRFNTNVAEILEANPFIPAGATTMPPGMPMKIPIYYMPLWGSPYRILPDSLFINGPAQVGFSAVEFAAQYPGWINRYTDYIWDGQRTGPEIIELVASYYSVSPRLLLAMLEYQSGALSQATATPEQLEYPLGFVNVQRPGLYLQLSWTANQLNNIYYSYRTGNPAQLEYEDGTIAHFDPWINSATVSLQGFYNLVLSDAGFWQATGPDGLAKVYAELYGDPWENEQPHIPGSLVQPEFTLPFEPGHVWAMTGGPHTGWGSGEPLAALDFAPPSTSAGCVPSGVWATAVTAGVVSHSEVGYVMLDLDGDGDERTGWNVLYMHLSSEGRPKVGDKLERGQRMGHPSCEGGTSTGTHIHIARKYNGEWVPAGDETLPFNLEGWVAHNGRLPYLGSLTRNSQTVVACVCSNALSFIQSERR